MNLEISTTYPLIIILIMTIVTLATRWGGVLIMSYVPISDRVQRFINAMSGSVLVALLAPIAVEGDNGARFLYEKIDGLRHLESISTKGIINLKNETQRISK